mmetsp:Transcript_29429/g.57768  ORF Transcript_29429/g.57768 Transcript_29429/m.57768 type:complete len:91 (+) Transcript_29429:1048-1320(+)
MMEGDEEGAWEELGRLPLLQGVRKRKKRTPRIVSIEFSSFSRTFPSEQRAGRLDSANASLQAGKVGRSDYLSGREGKRKRSGGGFSHPAC